MARVQTFNILDTDNTHVVGVISKYNAYAGCVITTDNIYAKCVIIHFNNLTAMSCHVINLS